MILASRTGPMPVTSRKRAGRSHLDPDQLCIALFDRAGYKVELIAEGELIYRAWVDDLLEPRGKYVVDM